MDEYRELLLGCGRDRRKRYSAIPQHPRGWRMPGGPVTLDINVRVKPDLWCDLNATPPWWARIENHVRINADCEAVGDLPRTQLGAVSVTTLQYESGVFYEMLPDYWDEIHAYQVLEHLGQQGDFHALFAQFAEIWRLLKPGGYFVGEVPSRRSEGLWGDPGHRRVIYPLTLVFLDQTQYTLQCDGPERARTPMADYRDCYRADFTTVQKHDNGENFAFVLQAVKPSRYVEPK